MDEVALDRLSPRERDCLTLVAELRTDKEIARELGIGPATLKTLVGRAMKKLGTTTRNDAARLLLSHAGRPPEWGTPRQGGQNQDLRPVRTSAPDRLEAGLVSDAVREERATFTFDELPIRADGRSGRSLDDSSWARVLVIAGIALAVVIMGLAVFPLAEGAQRIANMIEPPHPLR